MESLLWPSPSYALSLSKPSFSTPFSRPLTQNPSTKYRQRVHRSTKVASFLDLKPMSKPKPLDFDLPLFNPADKTHFDVIVIGAGPAGLRLAEQVSGHGINVCCIDPSPLSMWPNNYGVWVDEFETLGLGDCLDKTWPTASVVIDERNTKHLDRPYGRVSRKEMKMKFLSGCAANGTVRFHKTKAWKVEHEEFESLVSCVDGSEIRASLVVDASGCSSNFIEYDKPRNPGFQIAHGILAEVDGHPFDVDQMLLMDWRDSHLENEPELRASNSKLPTFLYAMPFDSNLIFLEETSVVARPILSYAETKNRMAARLRHLGIRVKSVIEEERCFIVMGGPLPKIPQSIMAVGANSGVVHPATGYTLARAMAVAPAVAGAIVECLGGGSIIRGPEMYGRVWESLWPMEKRREREYQNLGMEIMLRLDLEKTRRFVESFFEVEPRYWQGFLSGRLSLGELITFGLSSFGKASARGKLDIVTTSPVPVAKFIRNLALGDV